MFSSSAGLKAKPAGVVSPQTHESAGGLRKKKMTSENALLIPVGVDSKTAAVAFLSVTASQELQTYGGEDIQENIGKDAA